MRFLFLMTIALGLSACVSTTPKPKKAMIVGTGTKIDVLGPRHYFSKDGVPRGWVVEGANLRDVFAPRQSLPHIYMTQKDGRRGVHIQSGEKDFILARYQSADLLVTPYLFWDWHVSEHKTDHHPVRMLVGFYGGNAQSIPLRQNQLVWRGAGLPPYDRILAIGYDLTALKRGNIYNMGRVKYYVQRGGFEQTNRWHREGVDLSLVYRQAWPNDNINNVKITFVGMSATRSQVGGGMTFSSIHLMR
ncbi:hypothetical protein RYZ26_07375 [Terasakiella sp. A23]|uniref:hypothetical protein n=1 Tax=Terasakiella sp. FCG-A23 TaxID=3080561 RepID=UPI002953BDE1|nr:hypothetical protein [Terasakiella sp. A23]MDV7339407.1 hypothetical protein [Terasakiella sp. A23]